MNIDSYNKSRSNSTKTKNEESPTQINHQEEVYII